MKSVRIDITGETFGRLRVVRFDKINNDNRPQWICECICGTECSVSGKNLRRGLTRSCGCLRREVVATASITHGLSKSETYGSWCAMLNRCYNKKQKAYARYGALGVTVCDRWRHSFQAFFDDMGIRPSGLTLERKSPFGNYEPGNCTWATPGQQSRNQRARIALQVLDGMDKDWYKKAFEDGYTRI